MLNLELGWSRLGSGSSLKADKVMYAVYESPHKIEIRGCLWMCVHACVSGAFLCFGQKEVCFSARHLRYFLRQGCLLSTAHTDTSQILNTWGNFLFNLSAFKTKTASAFKKEPPHPPLPSFNLSWKYLSWIPLVSCNSPSSCFTVSGCQQCLIYFSSVGEVGALTWHARTGTGEVKGGEGGLGLWRAKVWSKL